MADFGKDGNGKGHDLVMVQNGVKGSTEPGSVYGNEGGTGGVVLQYWICDTSTGDCNCPPRRSEPAAWGPLFLAALFATSSIYCIGGVLLNRRGDSSLSIREAVPHRNFWSSVPGLARDGCGFFFWCFRRRAGMAVAASYSPYEAL